MNAARPVSACVGLLGLAAACSLRRAPPPGASGAEIYDLQNCANCHGDEREGKSLGPSLAGLAQHWTRETLVEYLADPQGFVERDPRLRARSEEYSGKMDPYDNLTLEQRGVLADWLLER